MHVSAGPMEARESIVSLGSGVRVSCELGNKLRSCTRAVSVLNYSGELFVYGWTPFHCRLGSISSPLHSPINMLLSGCAEWHCCEQTWVCHYLLTHCFSQLFWIYARKLNCWILWSFYLNFYQVLTSFLVILLMYIKSFGCSPLPNLFTCFHSC